MKHLFNRNQNSLLNLGFHQPDAKGKIVIIIIYIIY